MERIKIFELKSLYRESMKVYGFRFGEGEKTVCIVGAMRGNEVQQMYICSQLVKALGKAERAGKIEKGKSILVLPNINTYSMNIEKRFWPTDNTDINRMFPGYSLGETTQRVAAGVFEEIKDYRYGIQFASFYIPGMFEPHVKVMETGYEDVETAKLFGLPYVVIRHPRPYDTATLNYNWQIWDTKAFSLYANRTDRVDETNARRMVKSVFSFLGSLGIVRCAAKGVRSRVVRDDSFVAVKSACGGVLLRLAKTEETVRQDQVLARISDSFTGEILQTLTAPCDGKVFFVHNEPLVHEGTVAYRIMPGEE